VCSQGHGLRNGDMIHLHQAPLLCRNGGLPQDVRRESLDVWVERRLQVPASTWLLDFVPVDSYICQHDRLLSSVGRARGTRGRGRQAARFTHKGTDSVLFNMIYLPGRRNIHLVGGTACTRWFASDSIRKRKRVMVTPGELLLTRAPGSGLGHFGRYSVGLAWPLRSTHYQALFPGHPADQKSVWAVTFMTGLCRALVRRVAWAYGVFEGAGGRAEVSSRANGDKMS
jgi:hypothetical protein